MKKEQMKKQWGRNTRRNHGLQNEKKHTNQYEEQTRQKVQNRDKQYKGTEKNRRVMKIKKKGKESEESKVWVGQNQCSLLSHSCLTLYFLPCTTQQIKNNDSSCETKYWCTTMIGDTDRGAW